MDETKQILGNGTSLAVRQFVAMVRGEDVPHEPNNPWRVEMVIPSLRYCLTCYGPHWFDEIQGVTVDGKRVSVFKCRSCGGEA